MPESNPTSATPPAPASRLSKNRRIAIVTVVFLLLAVVWFLVLRTPHVPTTPTTSVANALHPTAEALSDADAQQFLLQHYNGEVSTGAQITLVTRIGNTIITRGAKNSKKPFRFHLLAEPNVIDVFALPSGDVYVTVALVNRMRTEGELAAALASGIAHVQAGDRLTQISPTQLQFTKAQETAADTVTVALMSVAGYDPNAYLGLFQVLTAAYQAHANVAFFSTHPSTQWRLATIQSAIKSLYPNGVPAVLSK